MTSACRCFSEFRCKSTAKKETAQKMDDFGSVLEVFWKFFGKWRKLFGSYR